jgi:hypothetical protein
VHDATGEHTLLDRRGDGPGPADRVDGPDVVLVPVLDALALGQVDAERGAVERDSMSWVASALPAKTTST